MPAQQLPKGVLTQALAAVTTGNAIFQIAADIKRLKMIVVGSAGIGAGAVILEESHDAVTPYAGTWAQLIAPITVPVSSAAEGRVDGPFMAVRVRVSTNITGGTADVYLIGT